MELPVIELTLEDLELDGWEATAFVDNPAIQRNYIAFKSTESKHAFKEVDSEKRICAGPLMVAEMPIYRNMDGREFFVKFSAETITNLLDKYMAEGRINKFNLMHDESKAVDGVYVQQIFQIDSSKGINTPEGFETLADGSIFAFVKVNNDEVWAKVKSGEFKGFSIEGTFSEKRNKFKTDIMSKVKDALDVLKKYFSSDEEVKPETTEEKKDVVMGGAKLADGTPIAWEGELTEGTPVFLEDGTPAPDGEHTFEDGTVIVVEGGIVTMVKAPEGMATETPAEPATDFSSEIESLKLQITELKSLIESNKPKDFTSEIGVIAKEVAEFKKDVFEAVKAVAESKDETAKKDKFRKADKGMNDRLAAWTERLKSEIKN